jgi:hypothetical protein
MALAKERLTSVSKAIREDGVTPEKGVSVPALRGVAADHRIRRRSSFIRRGELIRLSWSTMVWRSRQIVQVIFLQPLSFFIHGDLSK